MNKILLTLTLLSSITFADVHPALKRAIDSENYKQAENLVKNVGVRDVYCPATLSAKDADKIYGKLFSKSIRNLLDNCDAEFSRNYLEYKCAGGKDKAMCLRLVNLTDPDTWPNSYVEQFCTKKNAEVCATAVEKIPIEKSVPYLKAINANGLVYMMAKSTSITSSITMCKEACEMSRSLKLSGGIEEEIFRKKQEWYSATASRAKWIERELRDLEKERIEIRSDDYCDKHCPGGNKSKSEIDRMSHYVFEGAFLSLSQKAVSYYENMKNPIIPGLAENWQFVDKLIEAYIENMNKTLASAKDLGLTNEILKDYNRRVGAYQNYITEKNVLDTLKKMFVNGDSVDVNQQLFYCKIYPSLEVETEKLFGEKTLNCTYLLEENKKMFEPCHKGDLPLFDGAFQCVETQNGWIYTIPKNGELMDSRDGKIYKTVKIGKQEWMAENLNYEIGEQRWNARGLDQTLEGSCCYDYNPTNCKKYGRLYTSSAAVHACPAGWHLPSEKDFETLFEVVGGEKIAGETLKASLGWKCEDNASDTLGFSALPAGRWGYNERANNGWGSSVFELDGSSAFFWSRTRIYECNRYIRLDCNRKSVYVDSHGGLYGFSVRCVKD